MSLLAKSSTQMAASSKKQVVPSSRRAMRVVAKASSAELASSRRQILKASVATAAALFMPQLPAMAKSPAGFSTVEDQNDGYKFLYPFGWQEVSVKGADVVYKDVIEPLESVSVTIIGTDKADISEFGEVNLVCETLAKNVLSSPDQEVKLIKAEERETEGRKYYEFEFTAASPGYTRHQVSVVSVSGGRFFTLTTGSSERRWGKMKEKLQTSTRSFTLTK